MHGFQDFTCHSHILICNSCIYSFILRPLTDNYQKLPFIKLIDVHKQFEIPLNIETFSDYEIPNLFYINAFTCWHFFLR